MWYLAEGLTPNLKPGALERLLATDEAVPEAVIEPAVVLAVDVSLRREPPDLASEPCWELRGVEPVDRPNPTLPFQQLLVVDIDVVPEHRHQPHPRYHHPLPRIRLPPRRRRDGGADGRPPDGSADEAAPGGSGGGRKRGGESEAFHGGDANGLHGRREGEEKERAGGAGTRLSKLGREERFCAKKWMQGSERRDRRAHV